MSEAGRRREWTRFAAFHALASSAVLLLVASRYFQASPVPESASGIAFVALAAPTHFLGLALAASLPVFIGAVVRPGGWVAPLSVLMQSAMLIAIAVDTQVYALYRSHIDGMVIGLLGSGLASEILQPTSSDVEALAALLFSALVLQAGTAIAARSLAGRVHWKPIWLTALCIPFVAVQAMHVWADAARTPAITRVARVLPWMPALTAKRWLAARGWWVPADLPATPVDAAESDLFYPRGASECRASAASVRILMIVIEQWRFDRLDPTTTPNIFGFAADSLVFERHFSSGNASRYGVFGLLYGLHGDYFDPMLDEQRGPVLIDELLSLGARFLVAASAPLERPEFDRTVFAALRGRVPFVQPAGTTSERDQAITHAFVKFAGQVSESPFFAFLYYDSPHAMDVPPGWKGPYQPAERWGSRLALSDRTDPAPLSRGHANSIHYVDSLVGEVLDALRANDLLAQTTVVITGDHGEEFNDLRQGYWGHNGNFARFQTQVGMVMRIPGVPARRVASLTSHVDVVPTLMREVLACDAPTGNYSVGSPLLDSPPRDRVIVSGGSSGIGIIEERRITRIDRFGEVRVTDSDLVEQGQPAAEPEMLRSVFAELNSFRRGSP